MRTMTYMEAIREAMRIKMKEDENVCTFGEDVGKFGGCFGVYGTLYDEFGEKRVRDTPISEGAIMGLAIGSAATGLRPVAEIMMGDFVTVAMDMLVNQAAKLRYMTGGGITLPMVVRLPGGGGLGAAAQHSQSLEAWLCHVPGIKCVYPSTPADAAGLLISAINDNNPVAFYEHKGIYGSKGEVPDEIKPIPLGVADVKREGTDVTIVATGKMVLESLKAAEQLAKEGIEVEIVDPRTLFPLDKETIFKSIKKTSKALVVTEEVKRGGFGGEISAMIAEEAFDLLDAPVVRIGALNTPVPFASNLEGYVLPDAQDIINGIKGML